MKQLDYFKQTHWEHLPQQIRERVLAFAESLTWTLQETRLIVEMALDFTQWGDQGEWLSKWEDEYRKLPLHLNQPQRKKKHLEKLINYWKQLKETSPDYTNKVIPLTQPDRLMTPLQTEIHHSGPKIFGECPVASPHTVCCQLKTIDAVQNCAFGCHYCSIQTFYHDRKIKFESNLPEKLDQIPIDPHKFYHFGTGQSSDALYWGNKHNILSDLFNWARKHTNVFLEFKTKSSHIDDFLQLKPPSNVFVSWTLNPQTIITHEEPLTATLTKRLASARALVDAGVKVAFHFHPIIRFHNWKEEYQELSQKVMDLFAPKDIIFISMGTLTFIKPVIKAIRIKQYKTKILQMPFAEVVGRYSYPPTYKHELFKEIYNCFKPWHGQLFFYLCMEPKEFWESTFGYTYSSNDQFEQDLLNSCQLKLNYISI